MAIEWYAFSPEETFARIGSGDNGLSTNEARKRFDQYGPNVLPEEKPDSKLVVFISQFQNPLIYLLFAAGAVVFLMGDIIDGSIILAVLLFNAVVGAIQEGKAQHTLLALKNFTKTNATVFRDGGEFIIPDQEAVLGDVIILQEGEKVPADARIIFSQNLKVDEASLTGESNPVHKTVDLIRKGNLSTAEQKNIVFKGTHVVAGNGRAVIIATGSSTVIGNIAKEISSLDTEIPLKTNIRYLSHAIIAVVASISGILFISGIAFGNPVREMFKTVVALSVSVIPEGLPIVMTLVLATGVWRMSKQNALVKKMHAVEALGQARIIAVDKTGTITRNELIIRKVWVDGKSFQIGGSGYQPKGEIKLAGDYIDPVNHKELLFFARAAAFSANARISFSKEEKKWLISGDPTEAAIIVFAEKVGFHKAELSEESPQISEIPFDYKLKYHATVHEVGKHSLLAVAGAPEVILSLSTDIKRGERRRPLYEKERKELDKIFWQMSNEGLRVVALGIKTDAERNVSPENVRGLSFVGFMGMQDTLRPEVAEAVKRAKEAGIRVVMITGDHKITARAIAKEAGIYSEGDEILTGLDIDSLFEEELQEKLPRTSVFARVTPEHKMKIINAYKKRGEIVAMTGDGVNDAPSLVAADLGVSMGKIGTEVAKEASDLVLLDDNFGSIVSAVEEGRSIYKTIKKVILYLFSTSAGEVLTITVALFLGYPLPILAAQIIWLNFVTDGFLDVALAMEPKEKGLLSGTFERSKKYLVDSLMLKRMFFMALPMMLGTLFLFQKYFESDLAKAWTISLTTLAVFQWFNAWNCRSEKESIFRMNPFSNKFLIGATIMVIFFQLVAVYNPIAHKLLQTVPLEFSEWLVIILIAASILIVEEIRKFFSRQSPELA
ncbi:HAD-IC family P-type ATPase [Candidatus Giovannonibacteria bacterium]|nr:HAD-IC family P-type ATPase [Candidatus Giovannonibacteria bacterium]